MENLFRSYHPAFAGALKTMAVLYQSCNVLDLPLVHGQNSSPLAGLQYVRTDNIFRSHIYRIADVPRFSGTHYYLSQVDQSHDPELKQCRDTKAEFPSMYVYSGTADVTVVDAGQEEISAINLFRQSSSSAEEVGLDCSAFVSVAYQAGGLKFKEGDQCRPYDRIGSTVSFINYKNNLNCMFEPQKDELNTYSDTGPVDLFTGDVFTIGNYHTVIIGQVGYDGEIPDPFRLRRFTDISQCRLENFGYDVFDFDIIHSVASRSQPGTAPYTGLGVSRHHAGTYFRSDPTMGRHMRNYAVAACKRKFSPTAEPYRAGNMNILRHKAVPECMCEERAVLYKQSCLSGCPSPGN